ncbi:hypothetical protein RJ640_016837 [Escallonia rubra]|uniref:GAG-pre-integrase domain-containing protein n=1 Tax=Escallonia rubra TaxID=112253 RepID=A0AA88S3R4_9ASTE|nr:hypothetical protein RJ640_016837 [Escallonia rubra]
MTEDEEREHVPIVKQQAKVPERRESRRPRKNKPTVGRHPLCRPRTRLLFLLPVFFPCVNAHALLFLPSLSLFACPVFLCKRNGRGEGKAGRSVAHSEAVRQWGASGMLTTCVMIQPIEMIKVRIQLGQGSAGQVTRTMLKNEGIGAFYESSHFGVVLVHKALSITGEVLQGDSYGMAAVGIDAGVESTKNYVEDKDEWLGFFTEGSTVTGAAATTASSSDIDYDTTKLWHMRLGHMSERDMDVLSKQDDNDGSYFIEQNEESQEQQYNIARNRL